MRFQRTAYSSIRVGGARARDKECQRIARDKECQRKFDRLAEKGQPVFTLPTPSKHRVNIPWRRCAFRRGLQSGGNHQAPWIESPFDGHDVGPRSLHRSQQELPTVATNACEAGADDADEVARPAAIATDPSGLPLDDPSL
jgi:hypothetical protein